MSKASTNIEQTLKSETHIGVFIFDESFRITEWNHKAEEIFKLSSEMIEGKEIIDFFPECKKIYPPQKNFFIQQNTRVGSSSLFFDALLSLQYNSLQEITGGFIIVRENAAQKRGIQGCVFDASSQTPALGWTVENNAQRRGFSQTWLDFRGRTLSEEQGYQWEEGIHPEDKEKFLAVYLEAFRLSKPYEVSYRLQKHTGAYRRVLEKAHPRFSEKGNFIGYTGNCVDITELHQHTISELDHSKSVLYSIINNTETLIAAIDHHYTVLISNKVHQRAFHKVFGVEIKSGDNLLAKLVNRPKDLEKQKELWGRGLKGEVFTILEDFRDTDLKANYYEVAYSPVYDQQGNLIGTTAISRDVTLSRQQESFIQQLLSNQMALNKSLEKQNEELATQEEEIRQTNEELIQINDQLSDEREKLLKITHELQERNFELDQLMYKTSHDIRSPITSMLGLLQIIKEEDDPERNAEYLDFLEKRIFDLDRFTKSMLNYGKTQRAEIEVQQVDFEGIVQQCLRELQYLSTFDNLKKTIEIDTGDVSFYSDSLRISVIFGNIISNAIKYQSIHSPFSFLKIIVQVDEEFAHIQFIDNGIGISQEYVDKVFNMFFRATEKSDGSGLGMYIVKQTVEKLGGLIELKSQKGKGTSIMLRIPNQAGKISE